jgi:hypothetical protein
LFPDAAAIRQAEAWRKCGQRKPQFEGILRVGGNEIWSRMNFRSVDSVMNDQSWSLLKILTEKDSSQRK